MLGERQGRELVQRVLSLSKAAEQTEVAVYSDDSSLTRFANNEIHQNVAERDCMVVIKAIVGRRFGLGTTNDLSDTGLQAAIDQAIASANVLPDLEEFLPVPEPQEIPEAGGFSIATAEFGPLQRGAGVRVICERAKENGLTAAGAFRTDLASRTVGNSRGLLAHHQTTTADLMTVMMSPDSSGYSAQISVDVADVNPEAVANEALWKAQRGKNPQGLPAGEYEVVLESYAVGDMVDFLSYMGFGAMAVQEGRSFMTGKLGQRLMGPNISIWDDGLDRAGMPRPFDFEGIPKQRVDIIRNGVAVSPVYDRRTAMKDGKKTTGHALPSGSTIGPLPFNMFMAPGNSTREQMINSVKKGLLITRFWYTRVVHPLTVTMTGMTRDGCFLIENGEIVAPVRNLRFTQSYLEALNNVDLIGRDTKLVRDMSAANRVPDLKISRWAFTGTTDY